MADQAPGASGLEPDGDSEKRRGSRLRRLEAVPDEIAILLPDLELEAWNEMPAGERDELARLLARVLEGRGFPLDLLDVSNFGPEREQPIARYRHRANGLDFALVPGGRLESGLTDEQIEALLALGEADSLAATLPRRRAEVRVAPFLMSIRPVPVGCSALPATVRGGCGLDEVLEDEAGEEDHVPCYVPEHGVEISLRALGCELPDARELEWVGRGGEDRLFPWGNDLHFYEDACRSGVWDAPHLALVLPRDAALAGTWPAADRFGLIALAGASIWCWSASGQRGAWGGSGEWWPWQSCGEWLASIPGVVVSPWGEGHALRPVIPLGRG